MRITANRMLAYPEGIPREILPAVEEISGLFDELALRYVGVSPEFLRKKFPLSLSSLLDHLE